MDLDFFISRFSCNSGVIEGLAAGLTAQQARWKSSPEKWSILEIVNHLYDEEYEDFRPRLERTLRDPDELWAPITPQEWVTERKYNERDLTESVRNFLVERERSIDWLKSIANPRWKNTYQHPQQAISAGDLLASWLAHDLLHIKQISRVHYDYLSRVSRPFDAGYAGNWV